MAQTIETSEHGPWTVPRVLEQLELIGPLNAPGVCRALQHAGETLAAALRDAVKYRSGKAKIIAAALLLLLNDPSGRDVFLEAIAGPDGEMRTLAIDFVEHCICPSDVELRGRSLTKCPISSDELFAVLKRDLHEPWTGLNRRVLEIVSRQDYRQARSVTRLLLVHRDASLRREIAEHYLCAGRDEGAFAVVEELIRSAPAHVPRGDPRWDDFHQAKVLWYSLEMAAERGDVELRNKAASLAMSLTAQALDAPDCKDRFDFNDGLMDAGRIAKIMAAAMPSGGKELLERLISCEAVDGYCRGEALLAYGRALGDEARYFILSALGSPDLREYAARAMERLAQGKNDPHDIAALSDALIDEERQRVVAAIAKALLAAGPDGQGAVRAALDRAEPWTKVELSWRLSGGADRELAELLTEAGVMDPISDEQLAEAFSKGFDLLGLIWAGGERLVVFNVKSFAELEHFALFQGLLGAARPVVVVDGIKETCNAKRLREPVAGMPSVEKVADLGTVCTVSFQYQGQTFSFNAFPQGRWHDVPAVMRGFDDFMKSIGRDDRCYELELGGEYALFVVAPAPKFEPVAARLGIPLERDSESARDEAKYFQRKIQQH